MDREEAEQLVDNLRKEGAVLRDLVIVLSGRMIGAEKDLAALTTERAKLRESRQSLLALGGDVSEAGTELKRLRDRLELAEDTVAGISIELDRNKQLVTKNSGDIQAAERAVWIIEAHDLVARYNKHALELSKTVKLIHAIRTKLNISMTDQTVFCCPNGWGRNALTEIPKLYKAGDKIPAVIADRVFLSVGLNL